MFKFKQGDLIAWKHHYKNDHYAWLGVFFDENCSHESYSRIASGDDVFMIISIKPHDVVTISTYRILTPLGICVATEPQFEMFDRI